jgi:2-oxo-4-hydroxy-4-carboxy-5-ureidoimidazoline decarboxylase
MIETKNISKLNTVSDDELRDAFFRCSGSTVWTASMLASRPYKDANDLACKAHFSWQGLSKSDWLEAFRIHPRIGDIDGLRKKFASTASWASHEQSGTGAAPEEILKQLAAGNAHYEKKFGYIFIVCATGKSASEMLNILNVRLQNEVDREFALACEEQKKITDLRLNKLYQ